jgi:hypothetical protein
MILRRVLFLIPVISICATLLLGGSQVSAAQGEEGKVFDNGHMVTGPFYTFYTSAGEDEDSQAIFGQPITVVFDDPLPSGKKIQYFERARMELDPATNQVSLASLGEFSYDPNQPGLPAPSPANDPRCRAFPNGKLVCYAFRDFYDKYGEEFFGPPVTNAIFTLESRLVQYFQNVRMEWNGTLDRIVVTALGQVDFDKRVGNQTYRRPGRGAIPGAIPLPPTIPTLHAFAGKPLVASGDRQQVFVLLKDQFGEAIKGAPVTVTVYCPEDNIDGRGISGISSDVDGIAIAEFDVCDTKPNRVVRAEVTATVNGKEEKTKTWFRVWW